jgi:hypothetical protein
MSESAAIEQTIDHHAAVEPAAPHTCSCPAAAAAAAVDACCAAAGHKCGSQRKKELQLRF